MSDSEKTGQQNTSVQPSCSGVIVLMSPNLEGQGSGLTSTIRYDNPDFRAGLDRMFNIKPTERIKQIEMQDGWMTARIEIVKPVWTAITPKDNRAATV